MKAWAVGFGSRLVCSLVLFPLAVMGFYFLWLFRGPVYTSNLLLRMKGKFS